MGRKKVEGRKNEIGYYVYDEFFGIKAEKSFLIFDVIIENIGDDTVELSSSYVTLVDEEGNRYKYSSETVDNLGKPILFQNIIPGSKSEGQIAFDVEKDFNGHLEISGKTDEIELYKWD